MSSDSAYSAQPIAAVAELFASGRPVPGGVAAAALAAALGTSLVRMGTRVAQRLAGEDATLAAAGDRLRLAQARLLALADADRVAFTAVRAACRLPQTTDDERVRRAASVATAMEAATDSPLDVMATCGEVLHEAAEVAARVPMPARLDFTIGAELLDAALRSCGMCVAGNAAALTEEGFVRRVTRVREQIEQAAARDRKALRDHVPGDV